MKYRSEKRQLEEMFGGGTFDRFKEDASNMKTEMNFLEPKIWTFLAQNLGRFL
jgi:hypothetical protein